VSSVCEESIVYREMRLGDYDDVVRLWRLSAGVKLRGADSREGIGKYLLRNPGMSFVAEDGVGLVGTVMGGHDGKRGYIQHLATRSDRRESGVASRLLSLCLDALAREGILKSHIMVLAGNESGRRFWLNRGWIARDDIEILSYINSDDADV